MVIGESSTKPELNVDAEIKALFPRPTCSKPPNFPIDESLALYGGLIESDITICSIKSEGNACFIYNIIEMSWNVKDFFPGEERIHGSSAPLDGGSSWIIIGGQKYLRDSPVLLNTSEILISNAFEPGPIAPIPLSDHCTVALEKNRIFTAGGYGDIGESHLKNAFILEYNVSQSIWHFLSPMKNGRFGHACGSIKTVFEEVKVIAAGGLHEETVEIYSIQRQSWSNGPNLEEIKIFKTATTNGIMTFLVIGRVELEPYCTTESCRLDSIYSYEYKSSTGFVKFEPTLNKARGNHISVPIQSERDCSSKILFMCSTADRSYRKIFQGFFHPIFGGHELFKGV